MRLGIIGWPQVGKTTVFNALTRSSARTGTFGAAAGAPNQAIVRVPDTRVDTLSGMFNPKKTTYATVEYVDLPGFERGKGKESDAFLSHARKVDALVHVVRAFADEAVPHPEGSLDPARDLRLMEEELILADQMTVEKRIEKLAAEAKRGKKPENAAEPAALEKCLRALEDVQPLRTVAFSADEELAVRGFTFLSQKPLLVLLNIGEDQLAAPPALAADAPVLAVCGKLEEELAQLSDDDAAALMSEYGIAESSLVRMIQASYDMLGLMSFYTTGEDEVRAWTIRKLSPAVEAARTIHSDIARGFIRAEVVTYPDLVELKTFARAREVGKLRLEGKEYVLQDGEIVHFRFNV
ncbi:MAG: redox-regulated ATPase YchF [Candidatus Sericytochromatia bacterium]|nr:redox-regulated ATPase YchF [Candidatus Tanganyikabacteria bacterium]